MMAAWEDAISDAIDFGPSTPSSTPLASEHKGSTSYHASIEQSHPGYLRYLFRYAQKIRGPLAIFTDLADAMNQKSVTIADKPTIQISRLQLEAWFKEHGGKEYSATSKPLDTPEHIAKRIEWVRKYHQL